MPEKSDAPGTHERWAHFRFSIVGRLLAAPAGRGELQAELERLARLEWRHPTTGKPVRFARSTIERWYYQALGERTDPVRALSRKTRKDRGTRHAVTAQLIAEICRRYQAHPDWSYQLHYDNLAVVVKSQPHLGAMPSLATLTRFMKERGMTKRRRLGPANSPGVQRAEQRLESREVRSYESPYPNALWHLDYHHGSVRVAMADGQWAYPVVLGILDDHSRLVCHAQWFLAETAENLVHALIQAILKRGLPRALMTDNGSAMTAAETTQGLQRLGIIHETTLPYSPYQNGKQESFWGQVEGRLLAMIGSPVDLTVARLNEATLAWCEMEYNRKRHSELPGTPLEAFLAGKDVGRPSPDLQQLRMAFTARATRTQRRSDGTITLNAKRFEVPSRYGHIRHLHLRAASWDLSHVWLCDPSTGEPLTRLYPLDKQNNAQAARRARQAPAMQPTAQSAPPEAMAPLLRKLIADYAATGLPPAYIPKDEEPKRKEHD